MARMDKSTPSKMAAYSPEGSSTSKPHPHPPYTSAPRCNTSAQAPYAGTTENPSRGESHAKVRSYDSFKKIIEGPTYHPSHSRESSQASVGSSGGRGSDGAGDHSRTSSAESTHSTGRTRHFVHTPDKVSEYHRHGPAGTYTEGMTCGHSKDTRDNGSGFNNQGCKEHYASRYNENENGRYSRIHNQNDAVTRDRIPGSVAPVIPYRYSTTQQTYRDLNEEGRFADLPRIHRRRNKDIKPLTWSERTDQISRYERPEPDGADTAQYHPSHDQSRDLRHQTHDVTNVIPASRRHKLQRQCGVHIKEELPVVKQPRPVTEYLDRSGIYEQPPVLMRNRDGQARRGYVNSAYIEEGSSHLEAILEDKAYNNEHESNTHNHNSQGLSSQFSYCDPTNPTNSKSPIRNSNHGQTASEPNLRSHIETHKDPMKRTVYEAIQEREDKVLMRRHYVHNKYRPHTAGNYSAHEQWSIPHRQTVSDMRTQAIAQQSSEKQCLNENRRSWAGLGRHNQLHRPLSVSPDRKKTRRFNPSELQRPAQPQEVGLQKFTKDDTKTKGAAIMVHTAPPTERSRNNSGKMSPVVINVGEMTWDKIKRQVSKKNVYVVQQKEEKVKVRRVTKPKTHFTLSLFTLCFCLSPLGFIAMIFSVCSASAYKDKDPNMGRCYSKLALALSIMGIIGALATAAILIGTNTIPVIGRYEEN